VRVAPPRVALVALDLDGTVVDSALRVTPRAIATIERAREYGVTTTIVTGRMFRAARPFAGHLGIEGPIICYQGAGIFEASSGRILRYTPLASAIALRVVAFAKARELHVQLYADDAFYVEKISRFSELYAYVSGVSPNVVPSLEERFAHCDSGKAVIVTDVEKAEALSEELRTLLGAEAYVTRSNPEFVEVLPAGVDKGDALRYVARLLEVDIGATLAVGDSWNDIPLLRAAAFGVAMGSAPPAVKAAADAVVGDVAHDGVSEAYDRYVFP
jgi:Cof subfamily protein (haloacid dehalogenase superfamily)